MGKKSIDFIKGHMGGNEIILLRGCQIPKGREIEAALLSLAPPSIRGHQAGIFYKSQNNNRLKVKIVGATSEDFIGSCGGLTQVFGKALGETEFANYFNIKIHDPVTEVFLETDVGIVSLEIEHHGSIVNRVSTNMKPFIEECYHLGVQSMPIEGIDVMKVGEVLVVNGDQIRKQYSAAVFEKMDERTLQILEAIQKGFMDMICPNKKGCTFAVLGVTQFNKM